MLNTSISAWPSYTQEEALAVQRVLLSNKVNYWTGLECEKFETEFASYTGTKYAISLANGTVALEAALTALSIGPGDEVIVPPRTFIATISAVVRVGATPIFAEICANSGNINANTISEVLTKKTRAVICVHLAGWPCEMDEILQLSQRHDFYIIEDCAQAHGAKYFGKSVGSIGHIGCWSFCQDKIISTGGEGGMITTNDQNLWERIWSFKDHGKNYIKSKAKSSHVGFRWLHDSFGSNLRMTEMQAAIGRIQLQKLDSWSRIRNANAQILINAFLPYSSCDGPIRLPLLISSDDSSHHAQYKFYAYIRNENLPSDWDRNKFIKAINQHGVPCYQGSCSEVYLEKAFEYTPWKPKKRFPIAKQLGETSLMFLVHPSLTATELSKMSKAIHSVCKSMLPSRSQLQC